jgi:hypothetical protein
MLCGMLWIEHPLYADIARHRVDGWSADWSLPAVALVAAVDEEDYAGIFIGSEDPWRGQQFDAPDITMSGFNGEAMMEKLLLFVCLFSASSVPADTMRFQYINTGGNHCCRFIQATGEITDETPSNFESFWATIEFPPKDVSLHSEGGSLAGGIGLGEIFRARDITTEVSLNISADGRNHTSEPGTCASACAYAFLGGTERHLPEGAKLDGSKNLVDRQHF